MSRVVTGLSQNGDVKAICHALTEAGLPTESLNVIGPEDSNEGLSQGLIGTELFTSDRDMGVPGINNTRRSSDFFRNESLSDRLGDLEIPDGEIDNYVEALERGRSVVYCFAQPNTIDRIEEIFRGSGDLMNVRRF
ncbi:MAG: hypothetical protein IAI50_00020 [Candidatus Eremiobacteraeota bacterium]|nr:hypothetical protein [Candidatus Eremiobacteraeota bacterium]